MPGATKAKLFESQNTVAVARKLLGWRLELTLPDGTRGSRRITETEAYHGESDRACHASRGRTARTEVMYSTGGVWYVYLCYGIHDMLNLVTGPADFPAAVLIRGVEGLAGPGRLTRALGIDRRFNGQPVRPTTGLWLVDDGLRPKPREITATPRIGVDYAGPYWSAQKWRFVWTPPPGARA